ncbi:hypothetical protein [Pseudonocardia sp.]|uniref:DUF6992 family protein n=1 Tax=Pseudonocardia sp. TaxID=60912 RepID=UPI00261A2B2B|nr:hypothetical protein [Pseudonocardia sp.]
MPDLPGTDPWSRQDALARSTTAWGAASVVGGLGLAACRRGPFATAFGLQNAGWGAVDLAIVVVAQRLKAGRMARLTDPYAPAAVAAESRKLRRALLVNVLLDAGYVVGGAALWRRRRGTPGPAGASAGIVVQGAFLLAHDAHHAYWSGRR